MFHLHLLVPLVIKEIIILLVTPKLAIVNPNSKMKKKIVMSQTSVEDQFKETKDIQMERKPDIDHNSK